MPSKQQEKQKADDLRIDSYTISYKTHLKTFLILFV